MARNKRGIPTATGMAERLKAWGIWVSDARRDGKHVARAALLSKRAAAIRRWAAEMAEPAADLLAEIFRPRRWSRGWAPTAGAIGSCFDFSLGPVTSSHTSIGNFNLSFTVGSHGVPFGRGIPIGGYGLSDLITVGLSERGIGQQQSNYNGN
jgi:hypothetical protein